MFKRHLSPSDRLLIEAERAIGTLFGAALATTRPSPAAGIAEAELDPAARRQAAGLMRINHTGEVCAQALYSGQAAVARDPRTREQLLDAAAEETDHLVWCAERLAVLDSQPSLFNPFWYAGSFALGLTAALISDKVSLGFVVETERQVEAHLDEHLAKLPDTDAASRAVLAQMKTDEARHATNAKAAGGIELPPPVPSLMRLASLAMKAIVYRV